LLLLGAVVGRPLGRLSLVLRGSRPFLGPADVPRPTGPAARSPVVAGAAGDVLALSGATPEDRGVGRKRAGTARAPGPVVPSPVTPGRDEVRGTQGVLAAPRVGRQAVVTPAAPDVLRGRGPRAGGTHGVPVALEH